MPRAGQSARAASSRPSRAAATAPRELPGRRRLLGVVLARYVLKVPPLAELEIDVVARSIGPSIDRYISGEVYWGDDEPVRSPQ